MHYISLKGEIYLKVIKISRITDRAMLCIQWKREEPLRSFFNHSSNSGREEGIRKRHNHLYYLKGILLRQLTPFVKFGMHMKWGQNVRPSTNQQEYELQ